MKKRIVALILTVVMSLLALTSCGGFDFAKENLNAYVTFDKAVFLEALQEIKIDDGSFTTDDTIRDRIVKAEVYNAIATGILGKISSDDHNKKGELNKNGDALYFVYFATDAEGNIFYASNMNEGSVTNTATNDNHVVKLGSYIYKDDTSAETDEDFLQLVIDKVNALEGKVNLEDYIFDMYTKAELEAKAEKDLKAEKADATKEEIDAAKKEALRVHNGDVICIAYDVKYKKTHEGNVETDVTDKITYSFITVDENDPFHAELIKSDKVNVGSKTTAEIKIGDKTYTNIEVRWKQDKDFGENGFKSIASFEYNADKNLTTDKKVNADNTGASVAINKATLTYHVFPVYAVSLPSFDEITGENILHYVNGKNLTANSYHEFSVEGYKNGNDTLESLIEKVANIYATTKEGNPLYAEGENLKTLLDKYNDLGGSNPNADQKTENGKAKTALEDAQKKLLEETLTKIAGAKKGSTVLGDKIREEHIENKEHSLKEAYDNEIITNVQKEVLKLIKSSVKVNDYPKELLDEYVDYLYESYEYKFYKDNFDATISNYKKYNGDLNAYLVATLKVANEDGIRAALETEAKKALEPMIQIHVVAQALESEALAAMPGYIQKDIDGGAYRINEQEYRDYYKEEADKYIKDAKKEMDEVIKSTKEEADMFIIDDAYMRRYKSEIGSAAYRQQIKDYGDLNLRTALQVNKLFYYLTCTDIAYNEHEGHAEIEYVDGMVPFRTVKYTLNEKK